MAFDGRLLAGIGVLTAVVESGSFVRAGEIAWAVTLRVFDCASCGNVAAPTL